VVASTGNRYIQVVAKAGLTVFVLMRKESVDERLECSSVCNRYCKA
jgi:hypothetical protein